ncbi:MAG TPA: hypothetical protein V6D00_11710 [Pantanalinema sp.]
MKLSNWCWGALVPFLAVGCVYMPIGSLPKLTVLNAASSVGGGKAEIQVTPRISTGGLSIQSVVNPFGSSDVDHLVLKLFTVSGGTETPAKDGQGNPLQKDIGSASLADAVAFGGLRHDTTYRIRGYAYKAAGTAAGDLISKDASSSIDVAVARDDRPVVTNIPIQLIDKTFDGQATASNIVVTGGDLVDNGTETIQ